MTSIAAPDDVRAEWARDHGARRDRRRRVRRRPGGHRGGARRGAGDGRSRPKDAVILRGAAALGWEAAPTRRNARRLRRLRQLSVRLPARDEAVGDPGPPRDGGGRRAPGSSTGRASRGCCSRAAGRSASRRRARRRSGDRRAGAGARRPAADAALVVRAPQVVVAAGALRTPGRARDLGPRPPRDRPPPAAPPRAGRRRACSTTRSTCGGARCRPPARSSSARPTAGRNGYVIESAPGHPGPDRPRPAVGGHRRPRRPARPASATSRR